MSNRSILVVDDQSYVCRMFSLIITSRFGDIKVDFAYSSKEAIEKVELSNYDLVFLDVRLGEVFMDGVGILRFIKNIKPEQKVCIITGYEVEKEKIKTIKDEAVALLYKPFKVNEVLEIMDKYIAV